MKLINENPYRRVRTVPVNEQIQKRRWRLIGHILRKDTSDPTPESHSGHQKADVRGDDHALRGLELSKQRERQARLEVMEIYGARGKRSRKLEERVG